MTITEWSRILLRCQTGLNECRANMATWRHLSSEEPHYNQRLLWLLTIEAAEASFQTSCFAHAAKHFQTAANDDECGPRAA